MLKIKDNVDLKELEKYGFEYKECVNQYMKVYFPKLLKSIPLPMSKKVRGLAIGKNRKVIIKKKIWF